MKTLRTRKARKQNRQRRFAGARGWTVRSSVPMEQYKALGGATVSVCYGLPMRKVTARKRTDEYGREWMDEYHAPLSNVDLSHLASTSKIAPHE